MATFVGWSPTILGRVAFSRLGDHCLPGTIVANDSKSLGQVFGVTRRISHDGPLWPWMSNFLGRFPYSDWAFFLELRPGLLPFHKDNCHPTDESVTDTVLRTDSRAELSGRMYLVNGANGRRGKALADAIAATRDLAHRAMSGRAPDNVKRAAFHEARNALDAAFQTALRDNARELETPICGVVDIIISRSGMVMVDANADQLLTSIQSKTWQASRSRSVPAAAPPDSDLEAVADQAFFAMRDLTHQHYHHKGRSDLLTTVTPWTPATDEDWRRQTQYGLTRMAIAVRRRDSAESFRQALGIVAYADAFQKHFCGWHTTLSGSVAKSATSFAYDFASLRASVEASLKVRELKDSNRRARLFFMFGTAVTALSILVPTYRENTDPLPFWPDLFRDILALTVSNPIPTLALAAAIGWAVDHVFLGFALNPDWFERLRAGSSRLASGFMGTLRKRQVGARVSQLALLVVLGSFIALFCWATVVGWWLIMLGLGQASLPTG